MARARILPYVAGSLVAVGLAAGTVKPWEGKSNHAYSDPIGIPTICYGYTSGVRIGDYRSDDDCEALLAEELAVAFAAIDRHVRVTISNEEAAAYASFIYNTGQGTFRGSTLLKMLNAGDRVGACKQLTEACGRYGCNGFVYAGGKKLRGLELRRKAEQELCLKGAAISFEPTPSLWERIKAWLSGGQ